MHVLLDPYPQGAPVIVFYHFLHLLEDLIPLYNILKVLTYLGNILKINILDDHGCQPLVSSSFYGH